MKIIVPLFIAILSFHCVPDAGAMDSIIIAGSKEYTTFSEIIARHNRLKTNLESERNNLEDIAAYENRIKKSKENFSFFLNTVYEGAFELDSVSMDWGSNSLITKRELPLEFIGGEDGSKELFISTTLPHLRLRELITFKKNIFYTITFRLDENCVMQFINLKVVYRGAEILNEMSLPSL